CAGSTWERTRLACRLVEAPLDPSGQRRALSTRDACAPRLSLFAPESLNAVPQLLRHGGLRIGSQQRLQLALSVVEQTGLRIQDAQGQRRMSMVLLHALDLCGARRL